MADRAGTVRWDEENQEAYILTGRGWEKKTGDEALITRQAAEAGLSGSILTGLVDTLSFGLAVPDERLQAAQQQNPVGTFLGQYGIDIATLGGAAMARQPIKQGVKAAAESRMADRIQQRIAAEVGETGVASGVAGGSPPISGGSVGAAAADEAAPGFIRQTVDRVLSEFAGDPQDLTTAQRRFLESGARERLGFQLYPGQAQGRNLLTDVAKSDPFVAGAFDDVLQANYRLGNRIANEALGLGRSEEFGFDELGAAADTIGDGIEGIIGRVGTQQIDEAAEQAVERVLQRAPEARELLELETGATTFAGTLDGNVITSVRSILNDLSRSQWNQGLDIQARVTDRAISAIDDIIENAIGPQGRAEYKALREQWKVLKLFERAGSVRADGTIAWESLAGAGKLRKEFKGAFGRSDMDRGTSLEQSTRDLLDFARGASVFRANVADSGTATRLAFQDAISNPQGLAARLLIKSYLKREADRINDLAN